MILKKSLGQTTQRNTYWEEAAMEPTSSSSSKTPLVSRGIAVPKNRFDAWAAEAAQADPGASIKKMRENDGAVGRKGVYCRDLRCFLAPRKDSHPIRTPWSF